jgi:hypothetical protein
MNVPVATTTETRRLVSSLTSTEPRRHTVASGRTGFSPCGLFVRSVWQPVGWAMPTFGVAGAVIHNRRLHDYNGHTQHRHECVGWVLNPRGRTDANKRVGQGPTLQMRARNHAKVRVAASRPEALAMGSSDTQRNHRQAALDAATRLSPNSCHARVLQSPHPGG